MSQEKLESSIGDSDFYAKVLRDLSDIKKWVSRSNSLMNQILGYLEAHDGYVPEGVLDDG